MSAADRGRFPRWWLRYGSWLGPGVVLVAGVTLTAEGYQAPFGWDAVLARVVGYVLLLMVPAMTIDGVSRRVDWERARGRRPPPGSGAGGEAGDG